MIYTVDTLQIDGIQLPRLSLIDRAFGPSLATYVIFFLACVRLPVCLSGVCRNPTVESFKTNDVSVARRKNDMYSTAATMWPCVHIKLL